MKGGASVRPSISEEKTNARILVVDGQPEDRQLISGLIAQFPMALSVVSVSSAIEAMDYLGASRQQAGGAPDLLIVDFDMPAMGGPRLLARLRRDAACRTLPVVVLIRGSDPDTVRRAYDFGANAVIDRSGSSEAMAEIVRTLIDFWFRVADRYIVD